MHNDVDQPDRWQTPLLWLVRLAAPGALGMAGFLFYESVAGGPALPGCGPGSGCDAVLGSRWAYWLGVPVAGPAMGVYALLLAMSFQVGPDRPVEQRRLAALVMTAAAVAAAGAAVWFIILQAAVIGALCIYCTTTHGLGLVAAASTATLLWRGGTLGRGRFAAAALVGLIGIAVLAGGQVLAPPPTVRVESGHGIVGDTGPGAGRELIIMHGESGARLTPHDQPVLGSADADVLLVSLLDYTCSHCRAMHQQLDAVRERAGDRLGIVMLPVPLSADCHPLYDDTPPAHANACELAKLALAVWQADAAQFEAFDRWLAHTDETRSLEAARQRAVELVGAEALDAALASDWVQQQPARNAAVHVLGGAGPLPQLVAPHLWMQGRPRSADELWEDLSPLLGNESTGR